MGIYEPRRGFTPVHAPANAASPGVEKLLELEQRFPTATAAKAEAIRVELGMSSARYYQLLHEAIATREALELNPQVVHRVQDQAAANRQRRTNRSTTRRKAAQS